VGPGREFYFPEILADASLHKPDVKPGSRIMLRFHLTSACRRGSEILFQPLVTGPVEVEVSLR
jgi:hypothetical protein